MELARNIRAENVSRLKPTATRQLDITAAVADAVIMMRQEKVGCLLVRDGETLAGIFTERDLMTRVLGPGLSLDTPIRQVLTRDPVTVQANEPIYAALSKLEGGGYRHLPVVDDANRPVGMLSVKRLVHYLVEHFPATVYNQPPDPDSAPEEREGA